MPANQLQQRVLTALLIVPLPVAAVLLLPTSYLALCFGLIAVLAAWEWAALSGITSVVHRIAYATLLALCLIVLWQSPLRQWFLYLTTAAVVFWCAVGLFLFRLQAIARKSSLDPAISAAGLAVIIGPWIAIAHLHASSSRGPYLVLFLLVLIWASDILAYFTGRRWGRRKLAPAISPGKTWAGVNGALTGAALCGLLLSWPLGLTIGHAMSMIALCVLTAFFSVIGDLFESYVKRGRDQKDSGHLLPGHGGVLDRIDSVTAAAPVFAVGIWLEALAK